MPSPPHRRQQAILRQLEADLLEAETALKAGERDRARQRAQRVLAGVAYFGDRDVATRLRARAEAIIAAAQGTAGKRGDEELLRVPEDWLGPLPVVWPKKARARPMYHWERMLRARLRKKITVELHDATLPEACRELADLSECTILVDPAVAKDPRRITLPKMTVSLEHALRGLCRHYRLACVIRDGAILVSTRKALHIPPPAVVRVYDISRYLVFLERPGQPIPGSKGSVLLASTDACGRGWVDYVRAALPAGTWPRLEQVLFVEPPSIQYRNGRLVVRHSEAAQEKVGKCLADVAEPSLRLRMVARFIEAPTAAVDGLKLALQPARLRWWPRGLFERLACAAHALDEPTAAALRKLARSNALAPRSAAASRDQVEALLKGILERQKGASELTVHWNCLNTQGCQLYVARVPAAIDYFAQPHHADDEPEIGGFPTGMWLDVQPFVCAGRAAITVILGGQAALPWLPRPPSPNPGGGRKTWLLPFGPDVPARPAIVTLREGGSMLVRFPATAQLIAALRDSGIKLRKLPGRTARARESRCLILLLTPQILRQSLPP